MAPGGGGGLPPSPLSGYATGADKHEEKNHEKSEKIFQKKGLDGLQPNHKVKKVLNL